MESGRPRIIKWLLILFLITSCISTELLNAPVRLAADTTLTKGVDTTMMKIDTTSVSIGFHPEVEDWETEDIDMQQ